MKTVVNLNDWLPQLQQLSTDAAFCDLHRRCMVDCTSEKHVAELEESGAYSGPWDGWQLTTSDLWHTRIDDAIEAAAEADDPLAQEISNLYAIAFDLHELGHDELSEPVLEKAAELATAFHPKDAEAWFPKHRCHDSVGVQYTIAVMLEPTKEWLLCTNAMHSWVESVDGDIVDFMLFADPREEWYEREDTLQFASLQEYIDHLINYEEAA